MSNSSAVKLRLNVISTADLQLSLCEVQSTDWWSPNAESFHRQRQHHARFWE